MTWNLILVEIVSRNDQVLRRALGQLLPHCVKFTAGSTELGDGGDEDFFRRVHYFFLPCFTNNFSDLSGPTLLFWHVFTLVNSFRVSIPEISQEAADSFLGQRCDRARIVLPLLGHCVLFCFDHIEGGQVFFFNADHFRKSDLDAVADARRDIKNVIIHVLLRSELFYSCLLKLNEVWLNFVPIDVLCEENHSRALLLHHWLNKFL